LVAGGEAESPATYARGAVAVRWLAREAHRANIVLGVSFVAARRAADVTSRGPELMTIAAEVPYFLAVAFADHDTGGPVTKHCR
jgi:hypothetical protein